jgi:hypothetical protein
MIGVRLEGGLGNQLFQYAAARSLAIRHSTEVMIDQSALINKKKSITSRDYELNAFNCLIAPSGKKEFYFSRLAKRARWVFNLLSSWIVFVEKGEQFNKGFLIAPDNSYLIGFWQSYRYFDGIKEVLRKDFTPKNPLSTDSVKIKGLIDSSSPAIAIHVRRGDYVSLPSANNFHGALPLDYYHKGIEMMSAIFPAATYFVFSDDIHWCKENLGLNNDAIYVDHNGPLEAWQDLVLMGACHHHIIANSSFSWWGAWLGGRNIVAGEQTVIYPKNWFKSRVVYAQDRFPLNWHGI